MMRVVQVPSRWILLFVLLTMLLTVIPARADDRDRAYRDALRLELAGIGAPKVDVSEARRLIDKGVVLLDTRTKEEFAVSHLPGARLVPFGAWQLLAGPTIPHDLPLDTPIVVYCTIGWRSGKTVEALRAKGYAGAVNLYGGIIQWHNEGGALVDADGRVTKQVHPYAQRYARYLHD